MKTYEIFFSPTGGTKKVADILTKTLAKDVELIDLTDSTIAFQDITFSKTDISIIAVPSFGGLAPKTAIDRILKLQGNGSKAIIVAVYGNRAYEDTLIELLDTCKKAGFQVTAGVTAIAEHSIARQYAKGKT